MPKKDYSLTPKQKEAFAELKKAFAKCHRSKMIVWDWYGKISAVNGKVVSSMEVGGRKRFELVDSNLVEQFRPKCLRSAMADDEADTRVIYHGEDSEW